eukprot:TRINITY_DN65795_c0_g1_i1.p1 TRINITY_DN65795_c0_g1~~TRINITY_DN65795_c0_g1_i1.p1  ORF type:complete len:143 (+),score=14.68 TRINITY_DN65795_c0_g1_i1:183-611(+)
MIRFVLLQNRQGKTRFTRWYVPEKEKEKQKMEREIHRLVVSRDVKHTNFIEYRSYKIIYRRYAGLFFTIGVDQTANELSILELIHLFVEILDQYFGNVCELDLVFNFHRIYAILDEMVIGGELIETSRSIVVGALKNQETLD